MLAQNVKLKKFSDSVFHEVDGKVGERPLEWRRRFHYVRLPVNEIKIIHGCSVHDTEFNIDDAKKDNPAGCIIPNVETKIAIQCVLDEEEMRDSIYCAVEQKDTDGIYGVEKHKGKTYVTLRSGPPTIEKDGVRAGVYWGLAFRSNYEPGEDDLFFDLHLPEPQLNSLVDALRKDEKADLEIGAHLLSFSHEVDDFFREHYHPQDLIITDSILCFAGSVNVSSKIERQAAIKVSDDDGQGENDSRINELTPEQAAHQNLLRVLNSQDKTLISLKRAAWALVIVVFLGLLWR